MKEKIIVSVAALCIFLILSLPFASAITVNLIFNQNNLGTVDIDPKSLLAKDVTIEHDFNWATVNVQLLVESASPAHDIKKAYVYFCKDLNPKECVLQVPTTFESYVNISRNWKDISVGPFIPSPSNPQLARILTIANLDIGGKLAWIGTWDIINRTATQTFEVQSYDVDSVDAYLRSAEYSNITANFVNKFSMIPTMWVEKTVFGSINQNNTRQLYGAGGNQTDIPEFRTWKTPGRQVDIITREYELVFPESQDIANPLTFNMNPGYVCGDDVCESDLGETSATCCLDCGCAGEDVCDVTEASPSGVCVDTSQIALILDTFPETYFKSCEIDHETTFKVHIANAPSDLEVEDEWATLAGVVTEDLDREEQSDWRGRNVSARFTYEMTIPELEDCRKGTYKLSPNKLFVLVRFGEGYTRELSVDLPEITLDQTTDSMVEITDWVRHEYGKIIDKMKEGIDTAQGMVEACQEIIKLAPYIAIGAIGTTIVVGLAESGILGKMWSGVKTPFKWLGGTMGITESAKFERITTLEKQGFTKPLSTDDQRLFDLLSKRAKTEELSPAAQAQLTEYRNRLDYQNLRYEKLGEESYNRLKKEASDKDKIKQDIATKNSKIEEHEAEINRITELAKKEGRAMTPQEISTVDTRRKEINELKSEVLQLKGKAEPATVGATSYFDWLSRTPAATGSWFTTVADIALRAVDVFTRIGFGICDMAIKILTAYTMMTRSLGHFVSFQLCIKVHENLMGRGVCDGDKDDPESSIKAAEACVENLASCMGEIEKMSDSLKEFRDWSREERERLEEDSGIMKKQRVLWIEQGDLKSTTLVCYNRGNIKVGYSAWACSSDFKVEYRRIRSTIDADTEISVIVDNIRDDAMIINDIISKVAYGTMGNKVNIEKQALTESVEKMRKDVGDMKSIVDTSDTLINRRMSSVESNMRELSDSVTNIINRAEASEPREEVEITAETMRLGKTVVTRLNRIKSDAGVIESKHKGGGTTITEDWSDITSNIQGSWSLFWTDPKLEVFPYTGIYEFRVECNGKSVQALRVTVRSTC